MRLASQPVVMYTLAGSAEFFTPVPGYPELYNQ